MLLSFRHADRDDVPLLVKMLAADKLGSTREDASTPLPDVYYAAFAAIDADPNNALLIAEADEALVGFLQLTFIPYLTYRGRWRALIESVRIHPDSRGRGYGAALIEAAVARARARGCHMVQLTTDKLRPDALRFYEGLGFRASHEGMKLHLETSEVPVVDPG